MPRVARHVVEQPWAWLIVALHLLAVANIPRGIHRGRPVQAFTSSCATVAALVFLLGAALFPDLVPSSLDQAHSLDLRNASSSQGTLGTMAIIALIGMPLVLCYTGIIYWVFRGKVKLSESSY